MKKCNATTGSPLDSFYHKSGGKSAALTNWFYWEIAAGARRLELSTSGVSGQSLGLISLDISLNPLSFRVT